jgi:hypothetical protein
VKPSEVLDAAADLISPVGRWTQVALARTAGGEAAVAYGRGCDAVCWCAEGAIARIVGSYVVAEYDDAERYVTGLLGDHLAAWNDAPERTQAEVVAKLREAAALARSEGQ